MRTLVAGLLATTIFVPAAAFAQEANAPVVREDADPAAGQNSDRGSYGDIVVTAQRRDELLRDVPISITVLSAEAITSAGLLSTRDLQQVTPGLVSQNSGFQFRPTIRGIGGFAGGGAGDESNVALYIDNVYMPSPGANAFNLMNIERIEVLKGPQGTLFGRNATGGAIRIITAPPSHELTFRAMASYGFEFDSRELNTYVSGGVAPGLALSLNGYYYNDNGYVTNIAPQWTGGRFGRQRAVALRGRMLFEPTSDVNIVVGFDYGDTRSSQELVTTPAAGLLSFRNVTGVIIPTAPLTVSNDFESIQNTSWRGGYGTATWDLGQLTLQSTTSLRRVNVDGRLDVDRTNLPLTISTFGTIISYVTQELLATTDFDGPFNVVAGLYYFDSSARSPNGGLFSAPLGPVVNGFRAVLGPPVRTSFLVSRVDTISYAAFGEATFNPTSWLTLIGGLRYTDENKDATLINRQTGAANSEGQLGFNNLSYRGTVRVRLSDNAMVYATRSTGFKSGQFNATAFTRPLTTVRPETVGAWEAGVRVEPLPGVNISAAFYDYRYDDIQLTVFNTFNPALGTNILLNAAEAHTQGIEVEVNARVARSLRLSFGVSYLPTAEYVRFPNAIDYIPRTDLLGATQVVVDLSGTRMPYTPRWTLNAGFSYEADVGPGTLHLDGNAYYTDDFSWIPNNRFVQEGYVLLNGSIGWSSPGDRWRVSVFGRNLTNRNYFTSGGATTAGFSGAWARPREIGIRVGFGF